MRYEKVNREINKFIVVIILLVLLVAARSWALLQTRTNGGVSPDGGAVLEGPAMARTTVTGRLELDLGDTGPRLEEVRRLYATPSETSDEALRGLVRDQLATSYLQTIFREPAMPIPFDRLALTLGDRTYDEARRRLVVPYSLEGYVVAPADSLVESVPDLAEIGATYAETFIVPADPRHLFQRLGYACANQDEIPLGLVDDANYGNYFDPFCAPGVVACIHPEGRPLEPCMDVLARENGASALVITMVREPYDETVASGWSSSQVPVSAGGADLTVDAEKLAQYDIIYRRFAPDSCAIAEGCVGGPGVRRLLRFRAVTPNVGDRDLVFGDIDRLKESNQFDWSECHGHYHFNGYGIFSLEKDGEEVLPGAKQSFCVESTGRARNDAETPFTAPYQTCENQGIVAGWEDEYFAGLDCQWIDITDLPIDGESQRFQLSMEVNPLGLLCEGEADPDRLEAARGKDGEPVLGPNGKPAMKQRCDADPEFAKNNKVTVDVTIPAKGSKVTAPCRYPDFGPLRECGWTMREARKCEAGQKVRTYLGGAAMVRACPGDVPCFSHESLFNGAGGVIDLACPEEAEYLLMTAPYVASR